MKSNNFPDRLMSEAEVTRLAGMSRVTLWRRVKDGEFPAKVRTGKRAVRWRESEVQAWMAALPRAA